MPSSLPGDHLPPTNPLFFRNRFNLLRLFLVTMIKDPEPDYPYLKGAGAKFGPRRVKKLMRALEQGYNRVKACEVSGVTRSVFYDYLNKDRIFADQVEEAEERGRLRRVDIVESALFKAAASGNVSAQKFFLENHSPERYRTKKTLEVTGVDGGRIGVDITSEELKKEISELAKRVALLDA